MEDRKQIPEPLNIEQKNNRIPNVELFASLTPMRHCGIFPEDFRNQMLEKPAIFGTP